MSYKKFGNSKAVFANQDDGIFSALPITLDEDALVLETYQADGRKFVKAGSVVKVGTTVKGITAEEYDITDGPVNGRVVIEGYAYAECLTEGAITAASGLPKIVLLPYGKVIFDVDHTDLLKLFIKVSGAVFASGLGAASPVAFTSGNSVSSIYFDTLKTAAAVNAVLASLTYTDGASNLLAYNDGSTVAPILYATKTGDVYTIEVDTGATDPVVVYDGEKWLVAKAALATPVTANVINATAGWNGAFVSKSEANAIYSFTVNAGSTGVTLLTAKITDDASVVELEFTAPTLAGEVKITAIAAAAVTGYNGKAISGLPIAFSVEV